MYMERAPVRKQYTKTYKTKNALRDVLFVCPNFGTQFEGSATTPILKPVTGKYAEPVSATSHSHNILTPAAILILSYSFILGLSNDRKVSQPKFCTNVLSYPS
jgi:hypothetical protein